MSEKNVYRVKLMRWGDSSSSGRTVTFKLPDDTEEHPFKNLPVGAKNGQLVEIEVEILDADLPLETIEAKKKPKAGPRVGPKVTIIREPAAAPNAGKAPRAHVIDKRPAKTVEQSKGTKAEAAPAQPVAADGKAKPKSASPIPSAWQAPAMPKPAPTLPAAPPAAFPAAAATAFPAPAQPAPAGASAALAMAPAPQFSAPTTVPSPDAAPAPVSGPASTTDGPPLDQKFLENYAGQMNQAASALASAAEKLEGREEEDDRPRLPLPDDEDDTEREPVGVRTVRRAVELCTSVDKKRAGFFYYMRAMYPSVPAAENDGGKWSRDAKATRDRVCFHCETSGISGLADDAEARKKFEELEHAFERHERLR